MVSGQGYQIYWQSVGNAQQQLDPLPQSLGSLATSADLSKAAAATGCPETNAAIGSLGNEVVQLLNQLASALTDDNTKLAKVVADYHMSETTVAKGFAPPTTPSPAPAPAPSGTPIPEGGTAAPPPPLPSPAPTPRPTGSPTTIPAPAAVVGG